MRVPAAVILITVGVALIVAWAVVPQLPVLRISGAQMSLDQVHAVCSSGIGLVAQGLSRSASTDCVSDGIAMDAARAAGAAGLAGVVWGVFALARGPRRA